MKNLFMKRGSTLFLRGVVLLIALVVLALCLFVLPAGLMSDNTGYYRPLLAGLYLPAVPFFFALYQAWRLLDFIDKNKAFSKLSVEALQRIKYCALIISGLYAAGMPYIFYVGDRDDAPGAVAIGLVIVGASFVIATFAAVLQKLLESGRKIKSENDLTV
jgi:hypothetical protein